MDEAIIGGRNGYKSEICVYLDIVKILLKHSAQCADKQKSFGDFGPYSKFDRQLAITLLEQGVIDSNAVNENGQTLMDISIKSGAKSIILLLLEKGADCNIKNAAGQMPIHVAMAMLNREENYVDIVNLLIDHHTDLNVCNNVNDTPLHMAVKAGHLEIVRKLIQKGAGFDSLDNNHCTPLWLAVSNGKKEIVKVLIDAGADVNIPDNRNRKPLAIASKNGRGDIAKMIMDKLQEQNENLEPLSRRIQISDECPVCFDPRHDLFAFQPCGHTKICENCCIRIFQEPNPTCPICRTRATSYTKIFL